MKKWGLYAQDYLDILQIKKSRESVSDDNDETWPWSLIMTLKNPLKTHGQCKNLNNDFDL